MLTSHQKVENQMTATMTKTKVFLPWQDEKEEAWLEQMSAAGWHLLPVQWPLRYRFEKGQPQPYKYRLDFLYANPKDLPGYLQLFQDAGWQHLGSMSSWHYWRKAAGAGYSDEIFSDNESKIKKYQRLLGFLGFFLFFLIFMAINLYNSQIPMREGREVIDGIYNGGRILYMLIIPLYILAVVQIFRRIHQLKKSRL